MLLQKEQMPRAAHLSAGQADLNGAFPKQKSYQSRLFQKSEIVFVQNRQFCQLPFLPAKTIILAIDSNGAVGHLLTRSAVFVKM